AFCGKPQQAMPAPQVQQPYPGQQASQTPQQKKSRRGLVIGFSIGGVVLAAGIILLILFLTGVFRGNSLPGLYQSVRLEHQGEYQYVEDDITYLEILDGGSGNIHRYDRYTEYVGSWPGSITWDDSHITLEGTRYEYELSGDTLKLIDRQSFDGDILTIELKKTPKSSVPDNDEWP
ncbi:MAG: hypothetical protein IJP92_12955, partial [Lachnospiraceae bacterium]|nr:hypothetical protein [Lachnospiraceae bacterium]